MADKYYPCFIDFNDFNTGQIYCANELVGRSPIRGVSVQATAESSAQLWGLCRGIRTLSLIHDLFLDKHIIVGSFLVFGSP